MVLPIKNGDFPIKNGDFPIKNGDFPIKKGDFPWRTVSHNQMGNVFHKFHHIGGSTGVDRFPQLVRPPNVMFVG